MPIRRFLTVTVVIAISAVYPKLHAQSIPEFGMSVIEIAKIRMSRQDPTWIYSPLTRECSQVNRISVSNFSIGTIVQLKTQYSDYELYFDDQGNAARAWWNFPQSVNNKPPQALKGLADYNFRFDLTRNAQSRLPDHLRNEALNLYFSTEKICVTEEGEEMSEEDCEANTHHTLLVSINSIPHVAQQDALLFDECTP